MLGKLMKYEFKATARIFLPLYGALLAVSILNRLFINWEASTPSIIGGVLAGMMAVAIGVVTFILMLQRFNSNLLGSEGYLMFTLPVKADALILSKLLVSAAWFIISFLVVAAAVLVTFSFNACTAEGFRQAIEWLSTLLSTLHIGVSTLTVLITEGFLTGLSSLLLSILYLYACLSLSLLVNRRRLLFAFVAFLVINTAGQILGSAASALAAVLHIERLVEGWSELQMVQTFLPLVLLWNLVLCTFFYFVSRFMLTRRLNLE
jgi:hypothetical protein